MWLVDPQKRKLFAPPSTSHTSGCFCSETCCDMSRLESAFAMPQPWREWRNRNNDDASRPPYQINSVAYWWDLTSGTRVCIAMPQVDWELHCISDRTLSGWWAASRSDDKIFDVIPAARVQHMDTAGCGAMATAGGGAGICGEDAGGVNTFWLIWGTELIWTCGLLKGALTCGTSTGGIWDAGIGGCIGLVKMRWSFTPTSCPYL